jgi:hypothetical protein
MTNKILKLTNEVKNMGFGAINMSDHVVVYLNNHKVSKMEVQTAFDQKGLKVTVARDKFDNVIVK